MAPPRRPDPAWTRALPTAAAALALVAWLAPDALVSLVAAEALAEAAAPVAPTTGVVPVAELPEGSATDSASLIATARMVQVQLTVALSAIALGVPAWLLCRARGGRCSLASSSPG